MKNCYEGPPGTAGKGKCIAGIQACKDGFWSKCTGSVSPEPESCDGADNNCNGLIDEGVLSTCGTCDMSCTLQVVGPDFGTPFSTAKENANGVGIDKQGYVILDKTKTSVSFNNLWVANSPEATVSKVDTKTGWEIGRYKICSNPSRTSVDLNGDVWIGCRGDGGVAKIIADITKCPDKNGNGVIDTSKDLNGNHKIEANERVTNDECIKFIVYPDGKTIARAAGVDKNNHAWIGWWTSKRIRRLHPSNGANVSMIQLPCRPYGLVIDQQGIVWVQGAGCGLVRADPKTLSAKLFKPPFKYRAYGINVDVFGGIWFGGSWGAARYDPKTTKWVQANGVTYSSAVATSTDGHTYVVNDSKSTVSKINSLTATMQGSISLGLGRYPHGVALDYDGYVWAVNLQKSTVSKCNPKTMQLVGEYPVGPKPYTYSDMTGYTLNNFTAPKGHYTHMFGMSGWGGTVAETKASTIWEKIDAQVETPAGAYVKLRYRAGDSLAKIKTAKWSKEVGPFPPQQFPVTLPKGIKARFLQVEVFLQAAEKTKASPKLKALKAKGKQVFGT